MKKIRNFFPLLLLAFTFVQPTYAHRYFDSWCARWTTPDPMQRKYPGLSPYNYGMDNPIRFIDPNGDTTSVITSGPTIQNTTNGSPTANSLAGHTAIRRDGKVYSFEGDGKWHLVSYDKYVANEKQVRSVIEQTVNVDETKVQKVLDSRQDGTYNAETNSCVTTTMNALKAGGIPFNQPNGAVSPEQLSNALQNSGYVTNSERTISLSGSSIAGEIIYQAVGLLMNEGIINPVGVPINTVPLIPESGNDSNP